MKAKPSILLASIAALLTPLAFAQDNKVWDGDANPDGLWSTAANWNADSAPNGNDVLNFAGTTNLITTNDLVGGALDQYRIFFNAGAGNFTLGGAGLTLFDFGGNAPKVENNALGSTQTINLPLVLNGTAGGGFAEINPVDGNLTFGATGPVDLAGTTQLRIWGNNGNTVTFSGAISSSGNGGANQVAINQNSIVVFEAGNTYAGDTFINAGTLRFTATGSSNSSTLRLGDTSGTAAATLEVTGGATLTSPMEVRTGSAGTKTILSTTGANALNGTLAVNDAATVQVAAGTLTLGGALSGTSALTVQGNGTTVLSADNSLFSGNVAVNSTAGGALSTLRLSNNNALTAGTVTLNPSTTLAGTAGTTLDVNGVSIGTGVSLVMNTNNTGGSRRTTLLGSGTSAFNGAITVNGNDLAQFNANTAAAFTIGGAISAPTFTGTLFFRGAGAGTMNGDINAPTGLLNKTDGGTWTVSSPTLVLGGFQVSDGVLRAGRADLVPAGVTLTIGQPSATSGGFDMNGFNQTVTGLTVFTGSTGTNNRVTNSGAGTPTFTVNNTANFTYSGLITGNLNLSKTGIGTLALSGGTSTFVGTPAGSAISITGGVLQVSTDAQLGAAANGIFIDNNAVLRGSTAANVAMANTRVITIGAGGATFDVTGANFGTGTTANAIVGSATITKTGISNFRVQGANSTLTSNWNVTNGVLEGNNVAAFGTGALNVTGGVVSNGAGAGTFIANPITLAGGGIAPVNADNGFSGTVTTNGTGFFILNDFFQDTARNLTVSGLVSHTAGTDVITVGYSRLGSATGTTVTVSNAGNTFAGTYRIEHNAILSTAATALSGKTIGNAAIELRGGHLFLKDNNGAVSNAAINYGNNVTVLNTSGNGAQQLVNAGFGTDNVAQIDANRVDATVVTGNTFQLGTLTMSGQTLRVRGANSYGVEFLGAANFTGDVFLETTTAPLTLSGAVTATGALTKFGANTLTLANSAALSSLTSLAIRNGTLTLSSESVNSADRLADATPVAMSAGTLVLRGNAATATSESIGAVTIGSGSGLAATSAAPGSVNTTLTLAALTRTGSSATLNLASSAAGTLGGADKIFVTTGAPANNAANIVGGWAVNTTDLGFVGYDAATGFTPRAYTQTAFAGSGNTALVDRTAAEALAANADVNAARLGSGAITGAFTANLRSGGLILNNGATGVTHASNFSFSPDGTTRGPAYLYANNNDTAAVGGTLTTIFTGLFSASEIVKNGPGNLRFDNATNITNTGLAGAVITVNAGALEIGNRTAAANGNRQFPDSISMVVNGGSVHIFDNQTVTGLEVRNGATVRVGSNHSSGGTAQTLVVNNNVDNTFVGTLTSDDNNNGDGLFTKGGAGKYTFNGTMQIGRTVQVNYGELAIVGNTTVDTALSDRGRLIVNQGGSFTLDNSVTNQNNRITLNSGTTNGGGYLQLSGATFNYLGNPNVNSTETFGTTAALIALNEPFFGPGSNVINIVPSPGRAALLISERTIQRNPGATVLYKGANLGGTRGAADTASFNYNTSAPALVGGGGAASTLTFGIIPGSFLDAIIGGVDTYGIATISGTGTGVVGIRRLNAAEQTTTLVSGATALNNLALTATPLTGIDAATTINSLHLAGSSIAGTGTLTVNSGTILAANNGALGANALTVAGLAFGTREAALYLANDLSISSVITGTAGLTKGGAGTLTLSGANTFDATAAPANANGTAAASGVTINGGLLSIATDGNLGAVTNVVRLNNGGGLQTTATLTTARNVALGNAGGVIDTTTAGTTTTISGAISGSLGTVNSIGIAANTGTFVANTTVLTKTGAGILLLTGVNTYTGLTQVNGGTLLVGDGVSGSLPANSFVAVNNGGTLGGSGTIGGGVTVNSGGTLAPGLSPGLLTTGALTINNGATLSLELNTTTPATGYDQVSTPSVSLTGGAINLTLGFDPVDLADTFYVILNSGASPVSGTFAGLAEGATFTQGGQQFQITYAANWTGTQAGSNFTGGNDVALLAVPEPSAAAVLLAGLGLLGLRRRRS